MNDVIAPQFDLTPPSKDELRALVADLSEDERQVLLEHGTEAPFCASSRGEAGGVTPAVCADSRCSRRHKVRSGTGWPSFTSPFQKTT